MYVMGASKRFSQLFTFSKGNKLIDAFFFHFKESFRAASLNSTSQGSQFTALFLILERFDSFHCKNQKYVFSKCSAIGYKLPNNTPLTNLLFCPSSGPLNLSTLIVVRPTRENAHPFPTLAFPRVDSLSGDSPRKLVKWTRSGPWTRLENPSTRPTEISPNKRAKRREEVSEEPGFRIFQASPFGITEEST